uniref:Uncharacterized protein n=1 Tax=Anguilla anguilla TaxID=7936 RepID=A0A0E9STT6_ANGAN
MLFFFLMMFHTALLWVNLGFGLCL